MRTRRSVPSLAGGRRAAATPSVMGPRLGLKVAFGQASTGGFAVRPGIVSEDANAVDALVREVVAQAEELGAAGRAAR